MGFASRFFNGASRQTLYARVTPSPEQVEFLQTQWNELADHLKHELPQQHGYAVSTWLQGGGRLPRRFIGLGRPKRPVSGVNAGRMPSARGRCCRTSRPASRSRVPAAPD